MNPEALMEIVQQLPRKATPAQLHELLRVGGSTANLAQLSPPRVPQGFREEAQALLAGKGPPEKLSDFTERLVQLNSSLEKSAAERAAEYNELHSEVQRNGAASWVFPLATAVSVLHGSLAVMNFAAGRTGWGVFFLCASVGLALQNWYVHRLRKHA